MDVLLPERKVHPTVLARVIHDHALSRPLIAERTAINPVILGCLIRGQRPLTPYYANKLAPVLGVTPEELLNPKGGDE